MVIRVQGKTTVDDNRNLFLNNLTFSDGSSLSNLGIAPGSLKWTLDNPNAFDLSGLDDKFSTSISCSDEYLIVAAFNEDDLGGADSGKAYIYNVTTGALLWTLDNPNAYSTGAGDQFGWSVSISGNYAIVAARNEDDAGGASSGKAYIYNVATGALLFTLNNPTAYGTSASDLFGYSVGISGNYAIVGAPGESDTGGTSSGKAYIYNVTTGALLFTLDNPNAYGTSLSDQFGFSVAVSGNYAIVGAYGEDDATGTQSGKAYIYNVTTGALLFTLNDPNAYSTSPGDQFGFPLAVSGNSAIIAAYGEDDASGFASGKAYIYNVTTGALVFTLNNPNAYSTSTDDQFGQSVAISGNYAIVGAQLEDDIGGLSSGKAYIYNVTTGALIATFSNPYSYDRTSGDQFGLPVAINSSMAFVGAINVNSAQGLNSGAVYSFNLNNFAPMYTLTNPVNNYSGVSDVDSFGYSVAISGNYAIVGAYLEDDFAGINSGKAYIYNVTTGALLWTLNNPNANGTSEFDQFGFSVAISGNYAIVGANTEDDAGGTSSGKAYIYNVTTGTLLWTLNNPNAYSTSASDQFGWSVDISGNYAIVGAYLEDDIGGISSGKAYIFNVTTGQLAWTLNNPTAFGTSSGDWFGYAVAISDNYAIVSAFLEGDPANGNSGKAYIFNVTTGALLWTLNNPNAYSTSSDDQFGVSVGISGNYAIVGAYQEDDVSGTESGKVYIFNVTTGALLWTLNNPNAYSTSGGDQFGEFVDISGNYAIVGARRESDIGGSLSGKAYIYNVTTGTLLYTLNNPNAYSTSLNDFFGYSVAISGNYAIVGAYQEDSSKGSLLGKAYIFNLATPEKYTGFTSLGGLEKLADQNTIVDNSYLKWTLNNPNAYGTSASDQFGYSVAISGNYAIVGANLEDDGTTGQSSGKAYIFNVTTGALIHTLNNPNAYSTSTIDEFGYSVAISGNYAIVGAYAEDDAGGTTSGKAYIFNVATGALLWTLNNPTAYSTSNFDQFGISVAVSGNYAIIGARYEDDATDSNSGKAYIYNVTTGALLFTLNNPNAYSTSLNDSFGSSVAISGNYAIIGTELEDDLGGGADSGKAYIYNVTTGALLFTLNNPNTYGTVAGDQFGISVAVSGNYAIVGAWQEDDLGGSGSGKAYIFNATNGGLLYTLNNPNTYGTSPNDFFGYSVAISGNYAVIGSYGQSDVYGTVSGKAYIFNVTTGQLVSTLDNPTAFGTSANDNFGRSVAISGNYAIVGARDEDDTGGTTSGKAYIFNINNLNYRSLQDKLISLFHY